MKEFAEVYLELNRAIKALHNAKLKQDHVNAYLISCDGKVKNAKTIDYETKPITAL